MRELPILMNGAMVRAVLEGRKTVTRRVVDPAPYIQQIAGMYGGGMLCFPDRKKKGCGLIWPNAKQDILAQAPYQVGDRLYVRETYFGNHYLHPNEPVDERQIHYRADGCEDFEGEPIVWTPSIHMPKWAARIWLEVTAVRVERLRDITEQQVRREGVELREFWMFGADAEGRREVAGTHFSFLWDSLAKPGTRWADNPWVWIVEFKRIEKEAAKP